MDIKELDRLAKENLPMPNNLTMYEQCYYISSRGLYQQYADKKITLVQARAEKAQVVEQYKLGEAQWELFAKLFTLQDKLVALKQDGFNSHLEFEILEAIDDVLK